MQYSSNGRDRKYFAENGDFFTSTFHTSTSDLWRILILNLLSWLGMYRRHSFEKETEFLKIDKRE